MHHRTLSALICSLFVGCSGAYAAEPIKLEAPVTCWPTDHVVNVYKTDGNFSPLLTIDKDVGSIVILISPSTRDAHAWFVLPEADIMCLIDQGTLGRINVPVLDALTGRKETM